MIANKTQSIDILKFNQLRDNLNKEILEIRKAVYLPKRINNVKDI